MFKNGLQPCRGRTCFTGINRSCDPYEAPDVRLDIYTCKFWERQTSSLGLLPNLLYRAAHFADVEGILGFSVPSIILANLLGNTRLFVRVQRVRFCDLWLVALDPSGFFCISRFVACDSPGSGNNGLVCFEEFSDLSYSWLLVTCKNKAMSTSFPWQKLHSPSRLPSPFSVLVLPAKLGERVQTSWLHFDFCEWVMKLSSKLCDLDPLPGYVTRNTLSTPLPLLHFVSGQCPLN